MRSPRGGPSGADEDTSPVPLEKSKRRSKKLGKDRPAEGDSSLAPSTSKRRYLRSNPLGRSLSRESRRRDEIPGFSKDTDSAFVQRSEG